MIGSRQGKARRRHLLTELAAFAHRRSRSSLPASTISSTLWTRQQWPVPASWRTGTDENVAQPLNHLFARRGITTRSPASALPSVPVIISTRPITSQYSGNHDHFHRQNRPRGSHPPSQGIVFICQIANAFQVGNHAVIENTPSVAIST